MYKKCIPLAREKLRTVYVRNDTAESKLRQLQKKVKKMDKIIE